MLKFICEIQQYYKLKKKLLPVPVQQLRDQSKAQVLL